MECFLPCRLCSSGAVWIVFGVHMGLLRALVWVAVKWSENRELLVDEQVALKGEVLQTQRELIQSKYALSHSNRCPFPRSQ